MSKILFLLSSISFLLATSNSSIIIEPNLSTNTYLQSSAQAFYFFEKIENIQSGDRVECYCNDQLVGARIWNGPYTDVVAMGVEPGPRVGRLIKIMECWWEEETDFCADRGECLKKLDILISRERV